MAEFVITIAETRRSAGIPSMRYPAETSAKIRMACEQPYRRSIRDITSGAHVLLAYGVLTPDHRSTSCPAALKLRDVGEADLSIRKIVPIPIIATGASSATWQNVAQLSLSGQK